MLSIPQSAYNVTATKHIQYYAAQKRHDPRELLPHSSRVSAATHWDLMEHGPGQTFVAYSPAQLSEKWHIVIIFPLERMQTHIRRETRLLNIFKKKNITKPRMLVTKDK